ncbi:MAG: hypothetical protein JWM68_2911 [Verrucomicrobiales bacterium]|nr:hypothetical protein [Verrucomicrobiales bacterium]
MNFRRVLQTILIPTLIVTGSVLLKAEEKATNKVNAPSVNTNSWQSLFDGKTLAGWKVTNFGGAGEVHAEKGEIKLDMGGELTGISWTNGGLPTVDYEVELDAMKIDGNDFFCGLTFPVKQKFCSLIVGGWGGTVIGLSSIDGMDASENDTTKSRYLERNKWFHIRVRVEAEKIQMWLGDEQLIDVTTKDRKVGLRAGDIELSQPLGIATWQTSAALKNLRLRKL